MFGISFFFKFMRQFQPTLSMVYQSEIGTTLTASNSTTIENAVLVLSTKNYMNKPMVVTFDGKIGQ